VVVSYEELRVICNLKKGRREKPILRSGHVSYAHIVVFGLVVVVVGFVVVVIGFVVFVVGLVVVVIGFVVVVLVCFGGETTGISTP